MKKPFFDPSEAVDVILPTYNREAWLDKSIGSVVAQTDPRWRLWVVDDGSTDGTPQKLKSWQARDSRIQVLSTSRLGVSGARNHGIRVSTAPWVALLDSDDLWKPEKLEIQRAWLDGNPQAQWIHAEEIWVRNGVRVNPMKKHAKSGGDIFRRCLELCCVSPSAVVLRRSLLEKVGLFRTDFVVCEDYDLWLRIARDYPIGFIETPLVIKNGGHGDQLSRAFHSMDSYRIRALESLLMKGGLSEERRIWVEEALAKKSKILLKGFRKHQNLQAYDDFYKRWRKTISGKGSGDFEVL